MSFIIILMYIDPVGYIFFSNNETDWGIFNKYEWALVDFKFKIRERLIEKDINKNIIIIDIDEESLKELGQWPFPRTYYANLLKILMEDGAKIISFDILFPEQDRIDKENDKIFAMAIKEANNVILPMEFMTNDKLWGYKHISNQDKAVFPLHILSEASREKGFASLTPSEDGILRKSFLVKRWQDSNYYSMDLSVIITENSLEPQDILLQNGKCLVLNKGNVRKIPLDIKNRMIINYQGKEKTFDYIPFYLVYNKNYRKTAPLYFKDKYVFIGSSALSLGDLKATPFTPLMPGVEVHASVLNTILQENYIIQSHPALDILIIPVVNFVTIFFLTRFNPLMSTFIAIFFQMSIIFFSFAIFIYKNYIIATFPLLISILLCYMIIISYRLVKEDSQKRKLRRVFQRYVSPQIVKLIIKDIDNSHKSLVGKRKKLTIIFTDIRGFTPMSEKLTPEEVVRILNEYFTHMTDIIFRHDGTIDKFIGDAIMAFWGAPVSHKDDAFLAVKTCLSMMKKLEDLNKNWIALGYLPLKIGIGVNTGEVVVGNIGSIERVEYTAIGDEVNIASRLQSIAEGGQILITDRTYEEIKDKVTVNTLPPVKLKGKTNPIVIYEITGLKEGG